MGNKAKQRKTKQKPGPREKARRRRAGQRKRPCTGPSKARRLRAKRKLKPRQDLVHAPVLDRVRGAGPPVRNVESDAIGGSTGCTACTVRADTMVAWEHWSSGCWRKASRHQCAKHARKHTARLRRAK
jgi:hypothetical protein